MSVWLSKLFHLDLVYQKDQEERTRVPLSPFTACSQLILSLKGNINSWSSVLGYKLCVGRGGASHPDGQIMTFQVSFGYLV